MADRTWFGGSGYFRDAKDWSPRGVPQAGDTVTIATGDLTVSGRDLSGLTIFLEGTSDSTAPVLSLNDVVLDSNIDMAGLPAFPGGFGTIDIRHLVTSEGTISLGGGEVDPAYLDVVIAPHATFENTGTIAVDNASQLTVSQSGLSGGFVNDGLVVSYGGFPFISADVSGDGTFEVGPFPTGAEITFAGPVAHTLAVSLSTANTGDDLILYAPAEFHAAVSGVQGTNYVAMPNTPVDSYAFAPDGALVLSDHGAVVARLDLIGVTPANVIVSERGNGTDVSNGYTPPAMAGAARIVPEAISVAAVLTSRA